MQLASLLLALVLLCTTVPCESERKMSAAFIHLSPIAGGLGLCAEGPLPLARHRHWKREKKACAMMERQQEYSGQQKEIICSRRAHLAHLGIVMCAALAVAPPAFAKMQKLSSGITVEQKERNQLNNYKLLVRKIEAF